MAQRRWGGPAVGLPRGVFRPSGIFLALVAIFLASAVMAWRDYGDAGFDVFLMVVAGWLITLSLHEFAHAIVAYRSGDVGVAARGYLTLNLLKYTHPVLSIILPVLILVMGGIGLPGGAVWVDRHAVRGRLADSMISAAGPAVNVAFTIVLAVPFAVGVDVSAHPVFWAGLAFLAFLQLTASVLNLLPVPGLDGGNLLLPWLSPQWQRRFAVVAPFGLLIVFALLFQPEVNAIFFTFVDGLSSAIGLPPDLVYDGLRLLRFWS
jgi:Zn-dependent protease